MYLHVYINKIFLILSFLTMNYNYTACILFAYSRDLINIAFNMLDIHIDCNSVIWHLLYNSNYI